MNYTPTEEKLLEAMAQMDIVDAHEHLPPEHVRTSAPTDALILFAHYTRTDLLCAGMSAETYEHVVDCSGDLEQRWKQFFPFLDDIRYGTYARPAFIAAKEFYGFDDINGDNYRDLSEAISAANTPGIYRRVLRDKCRIRTALTQAGRTDYEDELLTPLMPLDNYASIANRESVEARAAGLGVQVKTLDDYLAMAKKGLERWVSERVVGIKTRAQALADPDRRRADDAFAKLMQGERVLDALALQTFLTHELFELAADLDIVVAVHAGMWRDFRALDAKHMITVFPQHPRTRFDLYHLSMPNVRSCAVICKNNPNVWLNLCWTHIISQQMTVSALDEVVDLVPMNKITGFGGDYGRPVEKVYGHLVMAREDIAAVLGRRVDRGLMGCDEAVALARKWLYDNPKALYRLSV